MIVLKMGDLHLGKGFLLGKNGIGATLNSRIEDQIALLDWILDRAIEHHAGHIFMTGDIFEATSPTPNLIAIFVSWLKKCQLNNVHVHIVLGNHDILRTGFIYSSSLDIISEMDLDNVSIYKDINTILIDKCSFTMVPFRDRKSLQAATNSEALNIMKDNFVYELASIPSTYNKIMIGHLAIEGSLPIDEIDDISNELFCPLEMFSGFDTVVMGHIHTPQVMQKANPYIAHIGSVDLSNFAEGNQKKHIMIFDCNDGSFISENLPTRPLQKIVIAIPKDTDDTTAYVLEQIKEIGVKSKGIVRVEVSLTSPELIPINKNVIDKFLMANGAFSVNGITENKKTIIIKKDQSNIIDTKMDVPSAIKMYADLYLENQEKSDFIELSMDIVKNCNN